jgi:GMP synthase-like glutamine amidotransferase/predicted DCC family thiol-disulfide oxidoreductase YuxK
MPLRLHVFQHVPFEGLGSLEPGFRAAGAAIAYTRFFAGEKPPAPDAFDMLVVLGGPMGVYDEEAFPWLLEEKRALRAALDAGRPVLGLCLGAQLLSEVLGGTVTKNKHREIGWWPVEKLPGLGAHPLARCFPDAFTTFHWHGDTFSLPPGATALFRSEGCENQGFAWGDRVVGLQFHPEVTPEAIEAWVQASVAEGGGDLKPGPYVQAAGAMTGARAGIEENNAWMRALCARLSGVAPKPVLFFDGVCGLCNGFVDFLLARDRRDRLYVAALQGETAPALVPADAAVPGGEDPRSMALWEEGKVYRKSDAVLRAVARLGGLWPLARVLFAVPRFARDGVYDFVARNRYRWFGKHGACRMPTPGERRLFLP